MENEWILKNPHYRNSHTLTKTGSIERSQYIAKPKYILDIRFKPLQEFCEVDTIITFTLNEYPKDPTFIECGLLLISYISINDKYLTKEDLQQLWDQNAIQLPNNLLQIGENKLIIRGQAGYSRDSSGLHMYVDQERKKEYCFSVCPPNFAHLIYPCFDQPDLKGIYDLTVTAPIAWKVISNTPLIGEDQQIMLPETNNEKDQLKQGALGEDYLIDGEEGEQLTLKKHKFEQTPPISTYLFSIVAGNYAVIEPPETTEIPMKIYCTQNRAQYFTESQYTHLFELIQGGIKFYEYFFGCPFPFKKFDQVFCPELKYLGMENPSCVLYTENFIFTTENASETRSLSRALTVLHELSHMWFGDYVTMKWWDDIWLNEGFASYIGHFALPRVSKNSEYKLVEEKFMFYKNQALGIDHLESTHPVQQIIENTSDAEHIFDEITYSKGSAIIKNLIFAIGEVPFSKCLQRYFNKFAWQNAESQDLFNVIEETINDKSLSSIITTQFDLKKWVKDWVETEGKPQSTQTMTIDKVNRTCQITFNFKFAPQSVSDRSKLLLFQCKLMGLNHTTDTLEQIQKFKCISDGFQYSIQTEKISTDYELQDLILIPNSGDYCYMDVQLDIQSLKVLQTYISQAEPLLKAQCFYAMMNSIIDARLNPIDIFFWVAYQINSEQNPMLLHEYLTHLIQLSNTFLPQQVKLKGDQIIFDTIVCLLEFQNNAPANENENDNIQNIIPILTEVVPQFASKPENMKFLWQWVIGKYPALLNIQVNGITMAYMMEKIFINKLFDEKERNKIQRDYIMKNEYYLNFVQGTKICSQLNPKQFWDQMFVKYRSKNGSFYQMQAVMKGFAKRCYVQGLDYSEWYFNDILRVCENNTNSYAKIFLEILFPKPQKLNDLLQQVDHFVKNSIEKIQRKKLRHIIYEKQYQLQQMQKISQINEF